MREKEVPGERRVRLPRPALLAGAGLFLVALIVLVAVARPRPGPSASQSFEPLPSMVTSDDASLMRQPSAAGESGVRLSRGARITVIADQGRWLRVRTASGEEGFLPAETVETDAQKHTRERRAAKILSFAPVFGVVAEETDILLAAFPLAARAGRLQKGTTVAIHAVDHAYYAFRNPAGGLAFINSVDVDIVPPDPRRPAIAPEKSRGVGQLQVTDLPPPEPSPMEGPSGESSEGPPGTGGSGESPVEQAVLLSKVDPRYPEVARRAGVEGTVLLEATIGPNGQVSDVRVLRGLPLGVSDAAAEAVRRWQYRPAQGRSGPIESRLLVRVLFALRD